MSTITTQPTLADLFDRFGPIPVARIRTSPPPGSATERDVIGLSATEQRLFELVDGVLVEKVMGHYESYLACILVQWLREFATRSNLGYVVGESGMMMLAPFQIRIPDVAFVSWSTLGSRQVPREPVPRLVPDLAVEIISKGNTSQEMDRKLREYFQAGVRLVWYIYPETSSVRAYASVERYDELTKSDVLDGGAVLPGFAMPLAQLFDEPPRE